jgi:serine/threonine protein phosphatase PrpC
MYRNDLIVNLLNRIEFIIMKGKTMIYHYGITRQGTYHVENNIVCQDAHEYSLVSKRFAIASVADGLGSESKSDIASKIAAENSVAFCKQHLTGEETAEEILAVIRNSFNDSLTKINYMIDQNGDEADQYDTTLVVAVYLNGNLYFGNAGDSGIMVLNQSGKYERVTTKQQDEDGRVYPLWFGEEKWEFGYVENVAGVLMATDGIFETLFPYLLKKNEDPVYVALAHYFMSEENLDFKHNGEKKVQEKMEAYIDSIPGSQVNDDKTILVMIDTNVVPKRLDDEYYKAPDWQKLKEEYDDAFRREAYPHLYDEEKEINDVDELKDGYEKSGNQIANQKGHPDIETKSEKINDNKRGGKDAAKRKIKIFGYELSFGIKKILGQDIVEKKK